MAEVAPAGGGGVNRNFLFIVGGLAALLALGLIAVGAFLILPGLFGGNKPTSAGTATPTHVAVAPTATVTRTSPPATQTPVVAALNPTATATRPVATATLTPIGATAAPATHVAIATLTSASVSGANTTPEGGGNTTKGGLPEETATPTTTSAMPSSGLGDSLLWLAGGVILLAVVFVARRARTSGS